jgi:hypothetical protein
MELPERIKNRVIFVSEYIGTSTNDWLIIKKRILFSLNKNDRRLFSKRHRYTKKQIINEFDKLVMDFWQSLTNVKLYISPNKIHDTNWKHDKPHGWALRVFNEQRRKIKKNNIGSD